MLQHPVLLLYRPPGLDVHSRAVYALPQVTLIVTFGLGVVVVVTVGRRFGFAARQSLIQESLSGSYAHRAVHVFGVGVRVGVVVLVTVGVRVVVGVLVGGGVIVVALRHALHPSSEGSVHTAAHRSTVGIGVMVGALLGATVA